jgi:gluconolactonase
MTRPALLVSALLLCSASVVADTTATPDAFARIGQLTTYDDAFHAIVPADARIEQIAAGFTWAEGPLWIADGDYLLFTDVPENTLHRWSERDGASVFLKPSGYDGPALDTLREAGANGLLLEPAGTVLLADSGTREVARLDLASKRKTSIAARYDGKRFNSPNDLVRRSDGAVFFTDPPYGLKGIDTSPAKELAHNGVYRIDTDGRVTLLDAALKYPNGIALSPDERTLYVANSDGAKPVWIAYTLDAKGNVIERRTFADASDLVAEGKPGLPDGLEVTRDGHLFATGPGGVIVFDASGKRLGRIETGSAVANVALDHDERTLYLTSHHILARVRIHPSSARTPD